MLLLTSHFQIQQVPIWIMKRRSYMIGTCMMLFLITLPSMSHRLRRWMSVRSNEQRIKKLKALLQISSVNAIHISSRTSLQATTSLSPSFDTLSKHDSLLSRSRSSITAQQQNVDALVKSRYSSSLEESYRQPKNVRPSIESVEDIVSGDTPLTRLGIDSAIMSWTQMRKHLRRLVPGWHDVEASNINLTRLKGAMTNYMILCEAKNVTEYHKVLIRIYGPNTDKFFPREREIEVFCKLSEKGFGPKLIGLFKQGRFEEFLEVEQLTKNDLRDETTMKLIAERMCEMHHFTKYFENREISDEVSYDVQYVQSEIWCTLQDWLLKAIEASKMITQPDQTARVQTLPLSLLPLILIKLKANIEAGPYHVSFCHNDTQYGNLLRNSSDRTIILVDYEYSSMNYRGFDIANHWCEYSADYTTDMPHLLDFNRLPNVKEQNTFLTAYLQKQYEIEGLKNVSNIKFLEDLNSLRKEADNCMVLSHLFWGLWGLIQTTHSSIEFNYFEYAMQRFDQAIRILKDQKIYTWDVHSQRV